MADSLTRTRPAAPADGERSLSVLLGAAAGALGAAATGLLLAGLLVLLTWVTDPRSGSSLPDALRTAGQAWLVAHGTPLTVPGGRFGLTPLGLTGLVVLLLVRSGTAVARTYGTRSWRLLVGTACAAAVPYGVLAAVVAGLSVTSAAEPGSWSALAGGLVVAGLAVGWGVLRASGLVVTLPARARAQLRAVTGSLAVLVGAGALTVAAGLGFQAERSAGMWQVLGTDLTGGLLLLALVASLIPNAVLWAVGFLAGPGFAVGEGTAVSPFGVELGAVPVFPLLGALPDALPVWTPLVLLAPVAAGVVGGLLGERCTPSTSVRAAALWGLAAGASTGLAVAALSWAASGPVTGGRLAVTGVVPWQAGLAIAVEVGTGAAAAAALRAWWRGGR